MTFKQKPGYLHAIVTGTNSKENVLRYLADILEECAVRDRFLVLIEERLEGPRLGTMDIFEIAAGGQSRPAGRFPQIAYVDVNATDAAKMNFAEDVVVNRGISVRVFPSVPDAERWLRDLERKVSDADF